MSHDRVVRKITCLSIQPKSQNSMAVMGNLAELHFTIRGKILTDAGMLFYGAIIMFLFNYLWL